MDASSSRGHLWQIIYLEFLQQSWDGSLAGRGFISSRFLAEGCSRSLPQKPGLLPASPWRISTHGCSGSASKICLGPTQPSIPLQGRVMVLQPCSALLREQDAPRHQVLLPRSLCLFSYG